MKYLKRFKTDADYLAFKASNDWIIPNLSVIENDKIVKFNGYAKPYLTFETIEDSTFKLTGNACEYSLDEGNTWGSLAAKTNTPIVPAGSKIMFKCTNPSITSNSGIGTFSSTGKFNVEGNIMSMLYGDNFTDKTDLTGKNYAFYNLFSGCTNVVEAHDLILPATTLSERCYYNMFYKCSSLTTAPELPATTLAKECYCRMFYSCRKLTTAPELPATTLADGCYSNMFNGCFKLTTTPELPATTLAHGCYAYMFSGCTSLDALELILPATTLTEYCYCGMFQGCTSLVDASKIILSATTLADYCCETMFDKCKNLTTAPELPATTLAKSCYCSMFRDCYKLTTAPTVLPATTLANYCYDYMFDCCGKLTTAPELPATTLAYSCYRYMFSNCALLNNITMLATDISAYDCLTEWVSGVASTGTFVKHKDMTSLPKGVSGIPRGWKVIDYQ